MPDSCRVNHGQHNEGSVSRVSTNTHLAQAPDDTPSLPAATHSHVKSPLNRRTIQRNLLDTYSLPSFPIRRERTDNDSRYGQRYIITVCRAFMSFGAPTHRLERYMQSTAETLGISLDSFYLPGCMILSFSDAIKGSSEVRLVRCSEALHLGKLIDIHVVHKAVIRKQILTDQAINRLEEISSRSETYPQWLRVLLFGLTSLCFGPISYGARPIDLPLIFTLATLVGFLQLVIAPRSELYGYVFEITAAILVSCLGRAFGSISWGSDSMFCFSAISQASIVLLLPGFTITMSALGLQSKNMVSGAVRMVYAIIYTLFLAFGFMVGSAIYGAIDQNATSATTCSDEWPFWWQIAFVVPFTVFFVLLNGGSWTKMPPMVVVTTAGWVVNHFSFQQFQSNTQIPQVLGALTVGLLSNLYSRLRQGLAIAIMHPAIYIQVPGSFAASGSLLSGLSIADLINHKSTDASTELAGNHTSPSTLIASPMLDAGVSMIEIAVSITIGLSVSALVVYPFRRRTGKSGIFSL